MLWPIVLTAWLASVSFLQADRPASGGSMMSDTASGYQRLGRAEAGGADLLLADTYYPSVKLTRQGGDPAAAKRGEESDESPLLGQSTSSSSELDDDVPQNATTWVRRRRRGSAAGHRRTCGSGSTFYPLGPHSVTDMVEDTESFHNNRDSAVKMSRICFHAPVWFAPLTLCHVCSVPLQELWDPDPPSEGQCRLRHPGHAGRHEELWPAGGHHRPAADRRRRHPLHAHAGECAALPGSGRAGSLMHVPAIQSTYSRILRVGRWGRRWQTDRIWGKLWVHRGHMQCDRVQMWTLLPKNAMELFLISSLRNVLLVDSFSNVDLNYMVSRQMLRDGVAAEHCIL